MSVHVISWVLKHSEATHSRRLVLLALADKANEDGTGAFPSVETLRKEARLDARSTVQKALRQLEADGHVRRTGTAAQGQAIYQVMMDNTDASYRRPGRAEVHQTGDKEIGLPDPTAAQKITPKPSIEPSVEPSSLEQDGSSNVVGEEIDPAHREAWGRVLTTLEASLPVIAFHHFIAPLELVAVDAGRVVVSAPPHCETSVRERYLSKLTAAARAEFGESATVDVRSCEPLREVS